MDEFLVQRDGSAFFIEQGGNRIAELRYSAHRDGKVVSLDHTEVNPWLRGRGIPKRLVAAAVDWARAEKIRLVPVCPYARHVFDRTPEYADVREVS